MSLFSFLMFVMFGLTGTGVLGNVAGAAQLVMLEEQGCTWCERWDTEIGDIYAKTREGQRAPLRRIDMHSRLPRDLSFLHKGSYTPTFILIENGKEVGRIIGYPGEDFFWGLLAQLMKKLAVQETSTNKE